MKASLSHSQARKLSQGVFLLIFLFLFLQTESRGFDTLGWPVKVFLDFDPLVLLSTLLSAHAAPTAFYLALTVVVLTVFLGRVFCGWVCPLGTLNNIVGALKKKTAPLPARNWRRVKYYVLVFLLASSLFTLQLVGVLDPISFLIRSLALSIYPLFSYGATEAVDALSWLGLPGAADAVYSTLRGTVLPFHEPHFRQAVFLGLLFFLVLGLNLIERRFWCRNFCPLGALLGLLSRHAFLKREVSEGCDGCGACEALCQGGAKPSDKEGWLAAECLYCGNCDDICPNNAVSFGFSRRGKGKALDLGRRRIIVSAAAGAVAVPLLRVTPAQASANPKLIRPPGALEEREFLRRCVRCGECMKVCITGGLQPTLLEAGLEGVWSPVLVPLIGYCEYRCTLCGQVCPTGAIEKLPLGEKVKVKLGLAMIDKDRCLPWAHATPCIVCEEVCPTPKKAVWLERASVKGRDGKEIVVQRPFVDLELCIGCGICEARCPVLDEPAIYVTSIGESRSRENRLLL